MASSVGIDVDITQLNALSVAFKTSSGRVGGLAARAVEKTAYDIESDAKIFAPVDTGNLQSSISTTITGDGRFGTIEAEIGPTADYGIFVELGTEFQAPAAYLGPAFDRRLPDLVTALGKIELLGGV